MSTWLYQLNAKDWTPETFRYEIWEGKPWRWPQRKKQDATVLATGDTIVFFYTPSRCPEIDRGFYGWAVLDRNDQENELLYFTPVAPTNQLKMDPWWSPAAKKLVDAIRGKMSQATLFLIEDQHLKILRAALRRHLNGG